jgi:signal peptidase II
MRDSLTLLSMNKALALILAFVILISDQLSKWAVMEYMIRPDLGGTFAESQSSFVEWISRADGMLPFTSIEILPFFNIVMVWNKGVSFGLFNDAGDYGPLALIALSVFIIGFFLVWMFRTDSKLYLIAMPLIIGGAFGNVLDRARFGAVVDFLDVHAFGFHWPAFNISDSAIVIGVFLLMAYSFFFESRAKNDT